MRYSCGTLSHICCMMVAMHIERVPNRKSHPTMLIRESYREDGKVKKRTIANITHLPPEVIDGIRVLLRGGLAVRALEALEDFDIVRSRPHGHVAAVLGTLRRIGLPNIISSRPSRERDLTVAMIVARVIEPSSKLATARQLDEHTLANTLGELRACSPPTKTTSTTPWTGC